MATKSSENQQLKKLRAENERLRKANDELRSHIGTKIASEGHTRTFFRGLAVILCIGFAVALLAVGNMLFWAGNTIVKTDQYVAATAPIIQNSQVQSALASSITQKLFSTVDVSQLVGQALPPKAEFLAPTIADQFQQHSDDAIKKVLQRPQFQAKWNKAQEHAHDRFIKLVDEHGSDGSIDIGEVYSDASQQLKGTKLGFLADKPLPAKAGKIQLVSGNWLKVLQKTISNIDTWRLAAIALVVLFSALGVWLSRNRRRIAVVLGSFFALSMLATLAALQIAKSAVGNHVNPQYADAAKQVYSIVTHTLVVQTWTLFAAALVMIFITWVSGRSSGSLKFKSGIDRILTGNLHRAIFSRGENGFTNWIGDYKNMLEWLVVAIVTASIIFARITPAVLAIQVLVILVLVLITEILSPSS